MKYHYEESFALVNIREVHSYSFFMQVHSFRSYFGEFENFKLIFAFLRR